MGFIIDNITQYITYTKFIIYFYIDNIIFNKSNINLQYNFI